MTQITVRFEEKYRREPVFPEIMERLKLGDLKSEDIYHITEGEIIFSGLEEGMQSGRPSFMIHIELPDGKIVMVEASMRSFKMASDLLLGRFGDQIT